MAATHLVECNTNRRRYFMHKPHKKRSLIYLISLLALSTLLQVSCSFATSAAPTATSAVTDTVPAIPTHTPLSPTDTPPPSSTLSITTPPLATNGPWGVVKTDKGIWAFNPDGEGLRQLT